VVCLAVNGSTLFSRNSCDYTPSLRQGAMLICLGLFLWLAIALAAGLFFGRFLRFGLKGRDAGNRSVYVRFIRQRGKRKNSAAMRSAP
jgi:hypothetical protein